MTFLLFKYCLTAFIIVFVSEIAKYNEKVAAIVSSLPIMTMIIMIWMYVEKQNIQKIANYTLYTFWYVLPTLPMFLIMPILITKGFNFWSSLTLCIIITLFSFIICYMIAKWFNINLIP